MELQHRNDGNCLKDNGEMESCSVQAETDVQFQFLVILWDSKSCSRDGGQ